MTSTRPTDRRAEWLGEVPASWEFVPANWLFSESIERARPDAPHLSATQKYGVIPLERFEQLEGRRLTKTLKHVELRKRVEPGDFVISMRSFQGGIERVHVPGSVRSSYVVLRPSPAVHGGFFSYLFKSSAFIQGLQATGTFIRDGQDLNYGNFRDLKLPLLDIRVQRRLSDHLDRATARINALVAKKTRFIELLREKRQSVIARAVTKGPSAAVPMKDSGVEWYKEVPAHWKVMKFGRLARVTDGLVDPRRTPYLAMPLIAPNHIESGTGHLLGLETSAAQGAESAKYYCQSGSVIYSKIRPALAKAVIAPQDCLCSADMYPLQCTERALPKWLFYLVISKPFTSWAILESDRVAMPKINRESLSELRVAVPPIEEQRDIAENIDRTVPSIDTLIAKTERSIELLREHRTALITAAVTGKSAVH